MLINLPIFKWTFPSFSTGRNQTYRQWMLHMMSNLKVNNPIWFIFMMNIIFFRIRDPHAAGHVSCWETFIWHDMPFWLCCPLNWDKLCSGQLPGCKMPNFQAQLFGQQSSTRSASHSASSLICFFPLLWQLNDGWHWLPWFTCCLKSSWQKCVSHHHCFVLVMEREKRCQGFSFLFFPFFLVFPLKFPWTC